MKKYIFILLSLTLCTSASAAVVNDNCSSDQSSQVQSAIDARTTNVILPAGCVGISKPIYAKSWISLQGAGKRLTKLKALPNFLGPALVIIGTNDPADSSTDRQIVFDSMVSDLTLDATTAPVGTSCAYVAGAQEGSGMQRVMCVGTQGATTDAIRIAQNVNRAVFREIEIYPYAAIRYGISNENAFCGCEISNITVGVSNPVTAGIRFYNGQFQINRVHCENDSNCIQIDGDNGLGVLTSIDGPTATTLTGNLIFVSGASKVAAQGLAKNGYSTAVLSWWGSGMNRTDPGIGQVLINN